METERKTGRVPGESHRPERRSRRPAAALVGSVADVAVFVLVTVAIGWIRGGADPSTATFLLGAVVVAVLHRPLQRWTGRVLEPDAEAAREDEGVERLLAAMARYEDPDTALSEVAMATRGALGAESVVIRLDVDGGPVVAAVAGQPEDGAGREVVEPIPGESGSPPEGEVVVLASRALRSSELDLLATTAASAAIVARTARLRRSVAHRLELAEQQATLLRELRAETGRAQLAERRRLERELHDTCQQRAVVVAGKVGMLESSDGDDAPSTAEILEDVELLRASIGEVTSGRSPLTLIGGGLAAALWAEAAEQPVPTEIVDETLRRYPRGVEEHLYACCLEAIRNAVGHGSPRHVTVRLAENDGHVRFEVGDDGTGFGTGGPTVGHGLQNMRSRMEELGGGLTYGSDASGTWVRGYAPVAGAAR